MRKYKIAIASILTIALLFGLLPRIIFVAPSKAAEYSLSNPRIYNGITTWDCVYFGNYWQNDTNGDGTADQNDDKEPIKWRVLSVDGNDAFLLADQALDAQPYHTELANILWENCSLRSWLNEDFFSAAFSNEEQSAIKATTILNLGYLSQDTGNDTLDKVYILSFMESLDPAYGFKYDTGDPSETRIVKNTLYAINRGASDITDADKGHCWLRTKGAFLDTVCVIGNSYGSSSGFGPVSNSTDVSVRPVLHLDLSSSVWKKTDTINSKGEIGVEVTPAPSSPSSPSSKPQVFPAPTPKPTPTISPSTNTPTPAPMTITAPGKVKKVTAKNNKKKSVTLSWKKVTGASGYQIQYIPNTAFAKKKIKNTKKTKLLIKKLKKEKIYNFRIRAYKISNGIKVYGNWSATKKIKIKK